MGENYIEAENRLDTLTAHFCHDSSKDKHTHTFKTNDTRYSQRQTTASCARIKQAWTSIVDSCHVYLVPYELNISKLATTVLNIQIITSQKKLKNVNDILLPM